MEIFKLNSKKDFWNNVSLNGMLLIELAIIISYLIPEKVLNNFFKIDGNTFLIGSGIIFVGAVVVLSLFVKISNWAICGTYIGITSMSIYWIVVFILGVLNKAGISLRIDKGKFFVFIILCGIISICWVKRITVSTELKIKEVGIIWFIFLIFLLFSIALSITLYNFFHVKLMYFSTFLFFWILWMIFRKIIRTEYVNFELFVRYLAKSKISDAIISFIFWNLAIIIISAICMLFFPKTTQELTTWCPIISVITSIIITIKLYGNKIQLFEKYIIIISCIISIVGYIVILIMILQREFLGTYTGLKIAWGIVLGIDAIVGLALRWEKAFLKDLEVKYNLEKRFDSEIVVARIGLMLGNITTFLTFVNFIFYNNSVTKKVIRLFSPFLEKMAPIVLMYYYKGKIDEHLKIIIFNIIVLAVVLMLSILTIFVEKYICRVVFYKVNKRER